MGGIAMTPADFKAMRESMGLSTKWLAVRWGVSMLSVQRWERNRSMPPELERDFESIRSCFRAEVDDGVSDASPSLSVPRVDDESPDGFPAAYHRAVALRIAESTGAHLVFGGES